MKTLTEKDLMNAVVDVAAKVSRLHGVGYRGESPAKLYARLEYALRQLEKYRAENSRTLDEINRANVWDDFTAE